MSVTVRVLNFGRFNRERVVWASRSGVHLVDRTALGRWTGGEELDRVLYLPRHEI
jgi:hypothetical protein